MTSLFWWKILIHFWETRTSRTIIWKVWIPIMFNISSRVSCSTDIILLLYCIALLFQLCKWYWDENFPDLQALWMRHHEHGTWSKGTWVPLLTLPVIQAQDSYQHIIMPLSSGLGYLTSTIASCSTSLGKMVPTNLSCSSEYYSIFFGANPFNRVQFKAEVRYLRALSLWMILSHWRHKTEVALSHPISQKATKESMKGIKKKKKELCLLTQMAQTK